MNNKALFSGMAVAVALLGSSAVFADTATATLNASVTVAAKCTAVSASAINFANYAPDAASANTGTSTVNVSCTKGTSATIALNGGGTSNTAARKLAGTGSNTDKLGYQLYSDSGYSSVWDDSSNKVAVAGQGLLGSNSVSKTVYASIPAAQDVTPDTYSDAVTVTVSY